MSRWIWFGICAILGLVILLCGLLVPTHLRAVDAGVVQMAGRGTPALVPQGLALAYLNELGAAQMLLQAAQAADLPNRLATRFCHRQSGEAESASGCLGH